MYCKYCGAEVSYDTAVCPKCGAVVNPDKLNEALSKAKPRGRGKNKNVAGVLAFFLGGLGIHRFYLGQWWGIFYLLFIWTYIPAIVSFIEAFVFWFGSEEEFDRKYNYR